MKARLAMEGLRVEAGVQPILGRHKDPRRKSFLGLQGFKVEGLRIEAFFRRSSEKKFSWTSGGVPSKTSSRSLQGFRVEGLWILSFLGIADRL